MAIAREEIFGPVQSILKFKYKFQLQIKQHDTHSEFNYFLVFTNNVFAGIWMK